MTTHRRRPRLNRYAAIVALVSILPLLSCRQWDVPDALVGTWSSRTSISVRYTLGFGSYRFVRDSIDASIEIRKDRSVHGRVGNAEFVGCSVEKNRGMVARTLDLFTDYIIKGEIKGRAFPADTLERITITIPFNLEERRMKGTIFQCDGADIFPMVYLTMAKQQ
jgi:hypothetical protein